MSRASFCCAFLQQTSGKESRRPRLCRGALGLPLRSTALPGKGHDQRGKVICCISEGPGKRMRIEQISCCWRSGSCSTCADHRRGGSAVMASDDARRNAHPCRFRAGTSRLYLSTSLGAWHLAGGLRAALTYSSMWRETARALLRPLDGRAGDAALVFARSPPICIRRALPRSSRISCGRRSGGPISPLRRQRRTAACSGGRNTHPAPDRRNYEGDGDGIPVSLPWRKSLTQPDPKNLGDPGRSIRMERSRWEARNRHMERWKRARLEPLEGLFAEKSISEGPRKVN